MADTKCNKCGEKVSAKAKYCPHCGNELVKPLDVSSMKELGIEYACTECDTPVEVGTKYCPTCGAELSWPKTVEEVKRLHDNHLNENKISPKIKADVSGLAVSNYIAAGVTFLLVILSFLGKSDFNFLHFMLLTTVVVYIISGTIVRSNLTDGQIPLRTRLFKVLSASTFCKIYGGTWMTLLSLLAFSVMVYAESLYYDPGLVVSEVLFFIAILFGFSLYAFVKASSLSRLVKEELGYNGE